MANSATFIRILASDGNEKGDLFARLMRDLFFSLGYDNPRMNVARSGREIDLEADHRFEARRAIGECKAVEATIGGREVNAFAGKLRPERRRDGRTIAPYFISLSGFTEPAIDQESESGPESIVLLNGSEVVKELINGHIIVSREQATLIAGRIAADATHLALDDLELLAHPIGWLWAVFFAEGKRRTHYCLIHGDGTPLAHELAVSIASIDPAGLLQQLTTLNPPRPDPDESRSEVLRHYANYLAAECGYILLDGLPADAEVGALRLRLEQLFVPLKLVKSEPSSDITATRRRPRRQRVPVGQVLTEVSRLAILASPGGGKSTLLNRLAVAYSNPERRKMLDDGLPDRDWLPLLLRCRDLRDKARVSWPELLDAVASRALIGDHAVSFRRSIDDALRAGTALVLVDGLDELTAIGDRSAFVRTLRTVAATYPGIQLVVTSRKAGFRHIASLLAPICLETELDDLSRGDIERLTVAWHREVVGARPGVEEDAMQLATLINNNDRIRLLASNPLLLTTLLLVKRWVGQLPTRRSVLYGKAVEVLLMTWNVEGYTPIDQEDALPQLCFVAFAMMRSGQQTISKPELIRLLTQSRQELAAELAFARIGIQEFVERIEHRSSLLMMTGHDVIDGSLAELYEFRHLTFQEYLAARAVVEGWYPGRVEGDSPGGILTPQLGDDKWREVIPLAATLAGRGAGALIGAIIDRWLATHKGSAVAMLARCVIDEPILTREVLHRAVDVLLNPRALQTTLPYARQLATSKYGAVWKEEVQKLVLAGERQFVHIGNILGDVLAAQRGLSGENKARLQTCVDDLDSADSHKRWEAVLALVRTSGLPKSIRQAAAARVHNLVLGDSREEQLAGCWGMSRFGKQGMEPATPASAALITRLLELWTNDPERALAIGAIRGLSLRAPFGGVSSAGLADHLRSFLTERSLTIEERVSVAIVSYHVGVPYTKVELAAIVNELVRQRQDQVPGIRKLRRLAAHLNVGDAAAMPDVSGS